MGTTTVSTLLNTPDSIIFGWTPVTGAIGYEIDVNNSGFVAPNNHSGVRTHMVLVNPLDNICVRVRYF